MNVTGAGDSLVGSMLGSITHLNANGESGSGEGVLNHPERMDEVIGRAQRAAVLSLHSEFAVSPKLSEALV